MKSEKSHPTSQTILHKKKERERESETVTDTVIQRRKLYLQGYLFYYYILCGRY